MKRLMLALFLTGSALIGCNSAIEQPSGKAALDLQSLTGACSYQSAVQQRSTGALFGDTSANCNVRRDGYDQLRLSVNLQRLVSGSWINVGGTTTTATRTLPAGDTQGDIYFSHIQSPNLACEAGTYRVRTVVRSYLNGSNTVYQTTSHLGLDTRKTC